MSFSADAVDQQAVAAIAAWLDWQPSNDGGDLAQIILVSPSAFLRKHANVLPAHLSRPVLASLTTPEQRAKDVPLVIQRRRRFASRAQKLAVAGKGEGEQPYDVNDDLVLERSRSRLPKLWQSLLGSADVADIRQNQSNDSRSDAAGGSRRQAPDPPFPDHPAATIPGYAEAAANEASGSAVSPSVHREGMLNFRGRPPIQYGPAHTGDLYSHPRLSRLMQEQDEEEAEEQQRQTLRRRGGDVELVEEDDEEDEAASSEGPVRHDNTETAVAAFEATVRDRFVRGDPTIPRSLYDRVDFDDSLDDDDGDDDDAYPSQSRGTTSTVNGTGRNPSDQQQQARRELDSLREDRYFEDEDDDDDQ